MANDTVFSVRFSSRDLRALDALGSCLGNSGRGATIRQAIREAAVRRGLWNVSDEQALPLFNEHLVISDENEKG
jgi:hypothetical protein